MNVLFLYHALRVNGMGFLRSHYFVEDLERRGHNIRFAYFIVENKEKWKQLQNDVITFDEVVEFSPDVLIFELGSADRFPSRDWLNELKAKGCIVVHCGLDYNDYNQNRKLFDEMYAGFGCGILKKKTDKQDTDELPNIRGSGDSQKAHTDIETLKRYCSIQDAAIFKDVLWVESHHALVIKPRSDLTTGLGYNILLTAGSKSVVKAYNDWDIHGENNAVYGAFNDSGGIEILITGHFVTDNNDKTEGEHNRTFLLNVLEYFHIRNPVRYKTEFNRASHIKELKTNENSLSVFLCHSSNDKPLVRKLYQRLKSDNFDPWLDEEKLLAGQEWRQEIPKAVRKADVVIVCLSRGSVNKAGYVQKEIKEALDVADEQPEGTIFLIPLKLEECEVPDRLSKWQWVNYFDGNGYKRLVDALHARASVR
jgi:hypothetical protein